jgi:hypothetical protein
VTPAGKRSSFGQRNLLAGPLVTDTQKTGRDPAQFGLFATSLEAMIAPDAEVRVIAAFVDQLELPALSFQPINNMGGLGGVIKNIFIR